MLGGLKKQLFRAKAQESSICQKLVAQIAKLLPGTSRRATEKCSNMAESGTADTTSTITAIDSNDGGAAATAATTNDGVGNGGAAAGAATAAGAAGAAEPAAQRISEPK